MVIVVVTLLLKCKYKLNASFVIDFDLCARCVYRVHCVIPVSLRSIHLHLVVRFYSVELTSVESFINLWLQTTQELLHLQANWIFYEIFQVTFLECSISTIQKVTRHTICYDAISKWFSANSFTFLWNRCNSLSRFLSVELWEMRMKQRTFTIHTC